MRVISLILFLALCGCERPESIEKRTTQAEDTVHASVDNALDRSNRLMDLEIRIQELEAKAKD